MTSSDYVITTINRSQAGTYKCMAWNGTTRNESSHCTVDVHSRPCSRSPCVNENCTDIKTPPSYRCTCPSDYQGRNCNQQITKETDRVRGKVTLERQHCKYHPDYNSHSSETYKELSNNFMENVVETSVTNTGNSTSQDHTHPDDQITPSHVTPRFKNIYCITRQEW